MSKVLLSALAVLPALCHGQYPGAAPVPAGLKPGFLSITEAAARETVGRLAGPDFRGRNAFNGDFALAAGWVVAQLQALGVAPGGDDGSYLHRFVYVESKTAANKTRIVSANTDAKLPASPDFSAVARESGRTRLPGLAFVNGPKGADWSLLDTAPLTGRWVLLSPAAASDPALFRRLAAPAGSKPVYALLLSPVSRERTLPTTTTWVKDFPDPRAPALTRVAFTAEGMRLLAAHCSAVRFADASPTGPSLETSDAELFVETTVATTERDCFNVVGKIEGSDPVLRKESVVVGSHLDHLGPGPNGTRFGADDNASGCAANLLIARALVKNPLKPRRSVTLCFWDLEESGLVGSYAFVQRPTVPLADVVAYINMDMVGRNEEDRRFQETPGRNERTVYPSGVAFNSPDLLKRLFASNAHVGLQLKPDVEDRVMRSDSGSFVWKSVPTVKVFSGDHLDYHRPGDTPDKVNVTKLANVARWLYLTVQDLASERPRPRWEPSPFKKGPWPDPRTGK